MLVPPSYQKEKQLFYGHIFITSQLFHKIIREIEITLVYICIHTYIQIALGKVKLSKI